jgi:hypothetical protein
MSKHREILLAALLLGILFSLQVMSARLKSPTYDEQGYIARGYAYVKLGDLHIRIGTPILLNALSALPLLSMRDVRLPTDAPSWQGTDFHPIGTRFMWHVNDNAEQILFMARVPTMMLALLLAVFVYRWARDLFGPWGGLLALVLCVFDPNLIAHGRLATTDLGATALLFIATYWAWRLLRRPTWGHLVATGFFFGLAQASKFSALLFGPIFALLFLWRAFAPQSFVLPVLPHLLVAYDGARQRWWSKLVGLAVAGAIVVLIASLTLWAVYGFEFGPLDGITSWPVPAPSHFEQLFDISGRLAGEDGRRAQGFLMGELYDGGRWTYFPVAVVLKTPLPTMAFLAGAIVLSLRRRVGQGMWVLVLPPLTFFAFSLASELNLGYRYILPALPFALVLAGRSGQWFAENLSQLRGRRRAALAILAGVLVGWSVWSGVAIYPHYLAFYNELAGGPDNGWRFLVDSNIDWGQDLKGLKRWMDERGVERLKLGYMGEAYPAYYGIAFDPLPSWPDRWEHPLHHELYFADPAPGLYAISVNLIQGRLVADPDTYAWFRTREPIDKVGYSIFIYDVPKRGEGSAVIGLSGLVPPDIRPEDYARLGTNDVHVLWFEEERALIGPAGDKTTLFLAEDVAVHPALTRFWALEEGQSHTTQDGRALRVFEGNPRDLMETRIEALAPSMSVWHLAAAQFVPGDPANHGKRLGYPVRFGEQVELLAYELIPRASLRSGDTLTVVTYWRMQGANEEPLKLFVHLLNQEGTYVAGEDRLDVWYENWRAGDLFAQVQEVPLGAEMAPGEYQVEIGWYRPETMQRLPVVQEGDVIADRVLLDAVWVE